MVASVSVYPKPKRIKLQSANTVFIETHQA